MNSANIFAAMRRVRVIPVVTIEDSGGAAELADALIRGGLPAAEVTFRTAAAARSIRIMKEKFPEMLIGAGTVLTPESVDKAIAAGADFIVSPGLNPDTERYCGGKGVPFIPGTATAGEIETALSLGLDFVKFFPAESAGGVGMLRALSAPFPNLRFMPTGGINRGNAADYLKLPFVLAAGSSAMVPVKLIAEKNWDEIARLTEELAEVAGNFPG